MNPFLVLNVEINADDLEIRQAYLELVKAYTAERDPGRFTIITGAYDSIKTKDKRYEYFLVKSGNSYNSPLDLIKNNVVMPNMRKPLPFEDMKSFLKQCARV